MIELQPLTDEEAVALLAFLLAVRGTIPGSLLGRLREELESKLGIEVKP